MAKSKSSNFKRRGDSYGTAKDLSRSQRQPQREALITLQGQSKTPKPNDICFACGGYGRVSVGLWFEHATWSRNLK